MQFQKTISFNTKDEQTGKETIDSVIVLINKLSVQDLKELAQLCKDKPGWEKKAINFKHLL
jgi:hypothetical protein